MVSPLKVTQPDPATFQATIAPPTTVNPSTTISVVTKASPVVKDLPSPPAAVERPAPKPVQSTGEAPTPDSPSAAHVIPEVPKPKVSVVPLVASRKVKGVRKVVARKSSATSSSSQYVPPAEPSSSSLPVEIKPTSDSGLYRKESEMSMRSSDSDTSSGDKPEEREDVTTTRDSPGLDTVAEVEVSPRTFVPLTKEPGTGQTVPMVIPEEGQHGVILESSQRAVGEKEMPAHKLRGRKLRQHQKKEEKLRRRENERSKAHRCNYQVDVQKQHSDDVFMTAQDNRSHKGTDKAVSVGGLTGSESSPSPLLGVESGSKDHGDEPEPTLTQSLDSARYHKEKQQQQELESSQESHPSTSSPEERTGEEGAPLLEFAVPSSAVRTRVKGTRQGDNDDVRTRVKGTRQGDDDDVRTRVKGTRQGDDDDVRTRVKGTRQGDDDVRTRVKGTRQGDVRTRVKGTHQGDDGSVTLPEESTQREQLLPQDATPGGETLTNDSVGMTAEGVEEEYGEGLAEEQDGEGQKYEGECGSHQEYHEGMKIELAGKEKAEFDEKVELDEEKAEFDEHAQHCERPQTLQINVATPTSTSDAPGACQNQSGGAQASSLSPHVTRVVPTSPHELAVSLLSSNRAIVRRSKHKDEPGEEVEEDKRRATSGKQEPKPNSSGSCGVDVALPSSVGRHHQGMPTADRSPQKSNLIRPNFSPDAPPFVPTAEFVPHPPPPANVRPRHLGPTPTSHEVCQGYSYPGYEDPGVHRLPPNPYKQRKAYPPAPVPMGRSPLSYLEYDDVDMSGGYELSEEHHTHFMGGQVTLPRGGHDPFLDVHSRVRAPAPLGFPRSDYQQQQEATRMFSQHHLRAVPPGFQNPGCAPLWDDSAHVARHQSLCMLQQEEEARRPHPPMIFRPHGRRSVDSVTMGAHNPPLRAYSAHEQWPLSRGGGGNLWENPRVPMERAIDMGIAPSDHHAPIFQRPTQRPHMLQRTYSEGSDLGGEMLPDLSSSFNTAISSRAPGSTLLSASSELPSQGEGGGREEVVQWPTDTSTTAWPSTIWSTSSPLSSQGSAPTTTSSSGGGRTYGLFESSGIWGNNSFSWVQPKTSQE